MLNYRQNQPEFNFGFPDSNDERPDSSDERLFAEWLSYHRFQYEIHPTIDGKVWDFWIPTLQSVVEIKPMAYWDEIDPLREAVLKQIRQGKRTRAFFVEMGRKVPFFHELITPQSSRVISRLALERLTFKVP
jgi:hypothetical protein